jgi:transcription initiation factor TFIID subunit 8
MLTESDLTRFMELITKSAHTSRRSLPTPLDYEYGLVRMGLTSASLRPHLKPPVSCKPTVQVPLSPSPEPELPPSVTALLGPELNGSFDKATRRYIPSKFPAFPSKHTYKATPKTTERETDPRKIREKATEAARHGEEALRRLVNIRKVGGLGARKRVPMSAKRRERQEIFERTIAELSKGRTSLDTGEEFGVIVNAEKQYWRNGRAPTRKASQVTKGVEVNTK